METDGTMRVYLRQMPKRENENENNEADTEVPSKAAICNLHPYDRVFNEYCTQDYIFRCALKRTILYALDGFNVTTIAYGHSDTGKTYTIFGGSDIFGLVKPEDAGMIHRSVAHLLQVIEEEQLEHTITVSYLYICNEKIYDLLSDINDDTELSINEDMDEKNSVVIQDLTEVTINNMPELDRILKLGDEKRMMSFAFEESLYSQRHSLFYVTIYTREESVSGQIILKRGNLIFVDVASSDYSVQPDRRNVQSPEDENTLHKSLRTFNECLIKLATGFTDIPYGDSILTRLLQDSLGGNTKTILLGTVNCSSLKVTGDLVYLAKKITTKPWIRHVFHPYNIIAKYKAEIEKLNSEIKHICTTTSLFPITDDTNVVIKDFEEKQTMIIGKVETVKLLNKNQNRWLAVYNAFKTTEDNITDMRENNNFVAPLDEKNLEINEQHFLNVNVQAETITDLQDKLKKQNQVFHENIGQALDLTYSQMAQLKDKLDLLQRFLSSKKTSISETIKECDEKYTDFKSFFTKSTKLIHEGMKNNEAIVTLVCKFSDIADITKHACQFQELNHQVIPTTIKYLTDQKEYVTAVTNNLSACISEITNTGRQYIETKRELYTKTQNTLTESMGLQKSQQMDFDEKYKNAVDGLKNMKTASDIYFQTTYERSKICQSNLTARHASLTEARDMINAWQRQIVVKVNVFAENIAKDREKQKGKLAATKKLSKDTIMLLTKNMKNYQSILDGIDIHMVETLYRVERNAFRQEANTRVLIARYFKDATLMMRDTASAILYRQELEENECKELVDSLNEYILTVQNLCNEKKIKCTYFVNKLDLALEQCKLAKFASGNIMLSEIPPDTEENERLEEESSENASVTHPERVKCNMPKYEGTLRERCKMRKTKSRRRREFEAEKSRKESCEQEEYETLLTTYNDLALLHAQLVINYSTPWSN